MGQFLTETSPFAHIVPVAGGITSSATTARSSAWPCCKGSSKTRAMPGITRWTTSNASCRRRQAIRCQVRRKKRASARALLRPDRDPGRRVGEMHKALAEHHRRSGLRPRAGFHRGSQGAWTEIGPTECNATSGCCATACSRCRSRCWTTQRLLDCKGRLLREIHAIAAYQPTFAKTRYHGDLHLGQVLLVQNDFVIIDFEGEPARPVSERRTKSSRAARRRGHAALLQLRCPRHPQEAYCERPGDRELFAPLASAWERGARKAFMAGYRDGIAGAACPGRSSTVARGLTDFFTSRRPCTRFGTN